MKKMNEGPFISETHNTSRRLAVFDDDGTCAYLYIYHPDSDEEIVADVFVYNRIPAPSFKEAKAVIPDQPPAPIGYASKSALCKTKTPAITIGRYCGREMGSRLHFVRMVIHSHSYA